METLRRGDAACHLGDRRRLGLEGDGRVGHVGGVDGDTRSRVGSGGVADLGIGHSRMLDGME